MSKRRKSPFDFFDEIFKGFDEMFEKLESETFTHGVAGGYSITVTYDDSGRPVVRVETHGDVDKEALRREIEEKYPGARIEGLGEVKKRIRFVDEEENQEALVRETSTSEEDKRDRKDKGFRIKVE